MPGQPRELSQARCDFPESEWGVRVSFSNRVSYSYVLKTGTHGANEYVHFTAKRVSRTCGGLAGAMLANCVPTL